MSSGFVICHRYRTRKTIMRLMESNERYRRLGGVWYAQRIHAVKVGQGMLYKRGPSCTTIERCKECERIGALATSLLVNLLYRLDVL